MKNKDTDIIFVLDRSGSMSVIEEETIKGYNDFLMKEKKSKGNVYVTTVLFDDKYELLYSRENINEVKNLTNKEYYARGCTALMDAVGKTIVTMDKEIDNSNRVVFVIMTDGLENASHEYNREMVKKLIKKHKKWEFVFLGANIDSYAEGASLGISKKRTANFKQTGKSIGNVFECARMLCESESVNIQEVIDN